MAHVLSERTREVITTVGTGALQLGGPVAGYTTFAAVLANGDTTYYAIQGLVNGEWEVGIGTYTASTNTLARTTILASSAAGATVSLSAGSKYVFITQPAARAVYVVGTSIVAANGATLPVAIGGTGATANTGTGNNVLSNSPVLVSPNLDTPTVLVGTNITGTAAGLSIGGSAATLTTPRAIDGQNFDGSAAITVIAPGTHAATSKATPVDADEIPLVDSAATFTLAKLTWANLKTTLATVFAARGANADITSISAITAINDGQIAGLRNRIINSGMAIDQRNGGAAQTFTAAAALAYCIDRWYGYCTGANVTGQRIAGSGNTQYRYRFTGAASVTKIGFAQRIEQANSFDLNNRAVVLGVELANSLLTTVTWTAWYANTADTFGTLASPTRTSISTGTITVNSTPTRYYVPITLPSAATTGIEIEFSVGAQISGTWTIGGVQLVPGIASELWLEQRPGGLELGLCQRYYRKGLASAGSEASNAVSAGRNVDVGVTFADMRATPTINVSTVIADNNLQSAEALDIRPYGFKFRANRSADGPYYGSREYTAAAEL